MAEAKVLETLFGTDIEIRFNHDRLSGGAWIKDGNLNASLGMGARLYTRELHEELVHICEGSASREHMSHLSEFMRQNESKIGKIHFEVSADTTLTEDDLQGKKKFHSWDFDTFDEAVDFLKNTSAA